MALPDTQFYSEVDSSGNSPNLQYAHAQTQWVVDNMDAENIAFVSHEGDLVQNGSDTQEWDNIDAVMDRLDATAEHPEIPYSVLPGNHDFATEGNRTSGITGFKAEFSASRF